MRARRNNRPASPHSRALALAAVLLLLAFAPKQSQATILWHMSVEELTATSDVVVIANIESQWVEWDDTLHTLHTYTRVRVEEVVTPEVAPEGPGAELVIEQDGGFLEDFGIEVAGNAMLVPGERALLFLLRGEHYYVHGMEQGKYTIVQTDGDVPRVLRPATVPVATQPIQGTNLQIEMPTVDMNGRTLEEMLLRVLGQQR